MQIDPTVQNSVRRASRRGGYTLIEILVVSAISLILMTVIAYIYTNSLRVYQETQGLSTVYETAKLINRDFRSSLGYCVPVPANSINPQTINFQGLANATSATLDPWYLDAVAGTADPSKAVWMTNVQDYDLLFSGSQFRMKTSGDSGLYRGWPSFDNMSYFGFSYYGNTAVGGTLSPNGNYGLRSYWMPAFFGRRDFNAARTTLSGDKTTVFACSDVLAGSWGWPRSDPRLDVDIDRVSKLNVKPLKNSTGGNPTISCWFYSENRSFNSPFTLALDNSNIVLTSFKFSYIPPTPATFDLKGNLTVPAKPEQTQLSVLRHSIVGFDIADAGMLRADETIGSMLRAIKITPYGILPGTNKLIEMGDAELNSKMADGSAIDNTRTAPAGTVLPRCFDIEYSLRNPYTMHRYDFALRVYCQITPQ